MIYASKMEQKTETMRFSKAIRFSLLTILLGIAATVAMAQDFPAQPVGHVNDFANLLSRSERQQLEMKLQNYRDTTTNVIAIATLPDLQGYSVEEVATQLFNDWKMWHEDRYNGVLVVVAPNERQMRIEVGYGLEGAIPDIIAGRIITNVLAPDFRQNDYYSGLDKATSLLIQLAEGEYEGNLTKRGTEEDDIASAIVFFLFLAFVIYASTRRGGGGRNGGRRRRTLGPAGFIFLGSGGFGGGSRGGGFGGGGFGGFSGGGGFGSGGGGASGGW